MSNLVAGSHPLLGPLVGLASWTFVMEAWMYAYRIPAMQKYNVEATPDLTSAKMNEKIPRELQFPADNYNHLHEQPTVFYAVILALDRLGIQDDMTVRLAWTYFGLRVVHSVVQGTKNPIMPRFMIFLTSSATLLGLTVKAALPFLN